MKYTENVKPYHRDVFIRDLQVATRVAGADVSVETTTRVLDALEVELDFERAALGWKTNSLQNRQFYYNVYNDRRVDLLKLLRDRDLIPSAYFSGGQPNAIYKLLEQEIADGADFNTRTGLCKVWIFTKMASLDTLYGSPHAPKSLKSFARVFAEHGIQNHFFVASDFEKNSMNVYVPWMPEQRTAPWVQSLARSVGRDLSVAMVDGVLATSQFATGIGVTFNWESDVPLRACFYAASPAPNLPALSSDTMDLRETLRNRFPSLRAEPRFYCSWSFGRAGEYLKFEKNYSGDMDFHIQSAYGLNPTDPHLTVGAGALG